jgi:hypothetical protein
MPRPTNPRMRTGPRGRYYSTLAVVSVHLDASTVTPHPRLTPCAEEPEGVHVVVWSGGSPMSEVTVPGDPDDLLPRIPGIVARERGTPQVPASGRTDPPGRFTDAYVTVAVCTRDRPDDLGHCLAAIDDLAPPPAEVLVMDNASRDTTSGTGRRGSTSRLS